MIACCLWWWVIVLISSEPLTRGLSENPFVNAKFVLLLINNIGRKSAQWAANRIQGLRARR